MRLCDALQGAAPAAQAAPARPWTDEIRRRHGSARDFMLRLAPARQAWFDMHLDTAVAREPLFTLARLVHTYGAPAVAGWLGLHLAEAVAMLGEAPAGDAGGLDRVAMAILSSPRYATLNVYSLMAFFNRLKCGECAIYGSVSPRRILEALAAYLPGALEREQLIRRRAEALAEEERRRQAAPCITFAEYCRRRGLDPAVETARLKCLQGT